METLKLLFIVHFKWKNLYWRFLSVCARHSRRSFFWCLFQCPNKGNNLKCLLYILVLRMYILALWKIALYHYVRLQPGHFRLHKVNWAKYMFLSTRALLDPAHRVAEEQSSWVEHIGIWRKADGAKSWNGKAVMWWWGFCQWWWLIHPVDPWIYYKYQLDKIPSESRTLNMILCWTSATHTGAWCHVEDHIGEINALGRSVKPAGRSVRMSFWLSESQEKNNLTWRNLQENHRRDIVTCQGGVKLTWQRSIYEKPKRLNCECWKM